MNTTLIVKAFYCGIEVEIICQMNHCSLIRFNERSFVVDTTDLVLEQNFKNNRKAREQCLGGLGGGFSVLACLNLRFGS